MPLTPEEFLGFDAAACPVCGGEVRNLPADCAVQGGEVDGTPGLLLEARCVDCHSTWTETFELTGYTQLEPSEEGLSEIVPTNVRNAIVDHLGKAEGPHPTTAQEWLKEIEYHLDLSLHALVGNERLPSDVDTEAHFVTECLSAAAFLRKAGVDTKEVSSHAPQD